MFLNIREKIISFLKRNLFFKEKTENNFRAQGFAFIKSINRGNYPIKEM